MAGRLEVSCLTPTLARAEFLRRAMVFFCAQGVSTAELVIVSEDGCPGFVRDRGVTVRYVACPAGISLGAKRNLACEAARGRILVHWDDDDIQAPNRLVRQLKVLADPRVQVTGSSVLHYLQAGSGRCWEYRYDGEQRPWVGGATLAFKREYWRRHPFPDVQVGEDNLFVWSAEAAEVRDTKDPGLCLCVIHGGNVSRKDTADTWWRPIRLARRWRSRIAGPVE